MKFVGLLLAIATVVAANNVLPQQPAKKITGYFAPVRAMLLQQVPEFDPVLINLIMSELRIKVKGTNNLHPSLKILVESRAASGARHPTLEQWTRAVSFEAMIAPYKPSRTTTAAQVMANFIDKIIALNKENPAIVDMLEDISKIKHSTWLSLMQAALVPVATAPTSEPRECLQHSSIQLALQQGIHACLVYDAITRLMFHNPTTFFDTLDEHYSAMEPQLKVAGAAAFWLVKFPSVRVPIKAFITSALTSEAAKAAAAKQAISRLEEDEDDDQPFDFQERLGRATLAIFKNWISKEPSTALRQNIQEACAAETVFLRKHIKSGDKYPPNGRAGAVLVADKIYGQLSGCNDECKRKFAEGIMTFTDSAAWMHLYSAWNLAFTMSAGNVFEWWAKLLTPAVLEDTTGKQYIIRRAIALWLAVHRSGFRLDDVNQAIIARETRRAELIAQIREEEGPGEMLFSEFGPAGFAWDDEVAARLDELSPVNDVIDPADCRNAYTFTPLYALQYKFGLANQRFSFRYQRLWGMPPGKGATSTVPTCHTMLKKELSWMATATTVATKIP